MINRKTVRGKNISAELSGGKNSMENIKPQHSLIRKDYAVAFLVI